MKRTICFYSFSVSFLIRLTLLYGNREGNVNKGCVKIARISIIMHIAYFFLIRARITKPPRRKKTIASIR